MFGNVIPLKEALNEDDKAVFNAYYCSLCRQIGTKSHIARLGLSYDMTFLAILVDAIADTEPNWQKERRCILHPMKKMNLPKNSPGLNYSADMSVLLIKAKFDDDARDDKSFLKRLISILISERKVSDKEKNITFINENLKKLAEIERDDIQDPDIAADFFAVLCSEMFSSSVPDERVKNIMGWLGYNIGRWTYLLDAFCDIEKDIKNGSYNPYKNKNISDDEVEENLYYTLSQAAGAFDLLPIKRYKSILENIIYQGLAARQSAVFHPEERKVVNESLRGTGCKSQR